MMKFSRPALLLVLMLASTVLFAQDTDGDKGGKKKKSKASTSQSDVDVVDAPPAQAAPAQDAAATAGNDSTKAAKDPQNQTKFMKADMEASKYNFYQRRGVSNPLMVRYDLDTAVYQKGKKKTKQQEAYKNNQYYFPARPKDQWELGINFGPALIFGDVAPYYRKMGILTNIGAGVTVRKSIGYIASIRFGYNFYMLTGRNWEPDANLQFNPALRGTYDSRVNYWNNPALLAANTDANLNMNKMFFYNYRTYMHEVHLAGVFNIGNIKFHRERNIVNFYLVAGLSGMLFNTKMDALDANGSVYDFSNVHALFYNGGGTNVDARTNVRKEANKRLDAILDGKYESDAEHVNNSIGFGSYQFLPGGTVGAGLQFHASKWVTVGLEQRIILTGSDLLDGYRWQQDEHSGFTTNNDMVSYTSINLLFNVGKNRTEPLYWLNPVHHTYKKLSDVDPQALAEQILKDDDNDGVPNMLDKEPNSKKDCPVDTKGVMLDSDKDGIVDCEDKEPYSAPGYPVDSNGIAILPPNPCCDTSGWYDDGSESAVYDENGNLISGGPGSNGSGGTGGAGANGGKGGKRRGPGNYDCSKIELPGVVFDLDKYYIDPQYYGNLHQIAERMQMCPDMRLVVTGYDESRNDQKYNEQLGWNRANSSVDYLVEKYGISRDRFIVKYTGGKKAAVGTTYEKKMKNKVEFRYANDGEGGDSNPPAPHPGLKAGSNK